VLHESVILKSNRGLALTLATIAFGQRSILKPELICQILRHIAVDSWKIVPSRRRAGLWQLPPTSILPITNAMRRTLKAHARQEDTEESAIESEQILTASRSLLNSYCVICKDIGWSFKFLKVRYPYHQGLLTDSLQELSQDFGLCGGYYTNTRR